MRIRIDYPKIEMLDDLALFVAVARAGSFSAAAAEAGVPLSTVSRRVGDLEHKLGEKLFERSTRKLRITAFGRLLLDRTEAPIESLAEVVRLRMPAGGVIRVTAPPLAVRTRLGKGLLTYLARNPGVSIDLVTTNTPLDFIWDNIDIAFRIGPLEDSSLVAVRLWDVPYTICVGGPLAEQVLSSGPLGLAELNDLPCIVTGQPWHFSGLPPFRPARVAHRIDELEFAAAAVNQGLGLAYLPRDIALCAGSEVPLDNLNPQHKVMHAVFLERRLMSAHHRDLVDWLKTA